MVNTLKIGTLNVAGLKSPQSQDKFLILQQNQLDILALQEAHCPENRIDSWKNFFYPKYSYWTQFTAFILSPTLIHSNFRIFEEGRIMCIDIIWNNLPTTIFNIYAPNNYSDRNNFLKKLSNIPVQQNTIFMGDFNQVDNPLLDKIPTSLNYSQGWESFNDFKIQFGLVDKSISKIFSMPNLTRIKVKNNGTIINASRIDYILSSPIISQYFSQPLTILTHISDHKLLQTSLCKPKLNSNNSQKKILPIFASNPALIKFISNGLNNLDTNPDFLQDSWSKFKCTLVKKYSRKNSRQKRSEDSKISSLERERSHLEKTCSKVPSQNWLTSWTNLNEKLKVQLRIRDHILFLQSGSNWSNKGERPNQLFLAKYKKRKNNTQFDCINIDNKLVRDPEKVAQGLANFYETLYKSKPISDNNNNLALEYPKTMSAEEAQSIMNPITINEVKSVIRFLPSKKAPGPDGLPYEIFKKNCQLIVPFLTKLFNNFLSKEKCYKNSSKSILITIYKKGEKEDPANWRPISLSNTDMKIFSKIISKRIGLIAQNQISPSQFGFIPNRYIWENINLVANLTLSHQTTGQLLFLDQEKAYDRVDWNYLYKILDLSGFPKSFIKLYSYILSSSSISISTLNSNPKIISPSRGLKQGDPLSPILYNYSLEPLLLTISKHLTGISLFGQQITKIVAFADDCVVAINNKMDSILIEKIFDKYQQVSQAKINIKKTQFINLNNSKVNLPWKLKIKTTQVTHLGIVLSKSGFEIDLIESILISSITNKLNSWSCGNISIIGRICLVNTFLISKLYFTAHSIPFSQIFYKKISSIIQKFIWNSQYPPLGISLVIGDISNGGLKLIDFKNVCQLLYGKGLIQVLFSVNYPIKTWFRARHALLSRDLQLKSPLLKLQFINYLTKNKMPIGPHFASKFTKANLQTMRSLKWQINSEYTYPKRGLPTKQFFLKINGVTTQINEYPPIYQPTSNSIPIRLSVKNNLESIIYWEEASNIIHSKILPKKIIANSWKVASVAYRTFERTNLIKPICQICHSNDTTIHRFFSCNLAQNIWNITEKLLMIPQQNLESRISLFSHKNSDCFKKYPPFYQEILLNSALWSIHSIFLNIINTKLKPTAPEVFNRCKNTLIQIIYPIIFYKWWPKKILKTLNPWKTSNAFSINYKTHTIEFTQDFKEIHTLPFF